MNNITTTSNTEVNKLTFKSALLTAINNAYYEDRNIMLIVQKEDGVELMDVKVKHRITSHVVEVSQDVKVEVAQELYSKTITFDLYLDSVIEYKYKGRSRKR